MINNCFNKDDTTKNHKLEKENKIKSVSERQRKTKIVRQTGRDKEKAGNRKRERK